MFPLLFLNPSVPPKPVPAPIVVDGLDYKTQRKHDVILYLGKKIEYQRTLRNLEKQKKLNESK